VPKRPGMPARQLKTTVQRLNKSALIENPAPFGAGFFLFGGFWWLGPGEWAFCAARAAVGSKFKVQSSKGLLLLGVSALALAHSVLLEPLLVQNSKFKVQKDYSCSASVPWRWCILLCSSRCWFKIQSSKFKREQALADMDSLKNTLSCNQTPPS
jgi:hypothetical protein